MAWDLQLTYATSGAVNTILAGAVVVTMDVTDSVVIDPGVLAAAEGEEAPTPQVIRRAPRMVAKR